MRDALHGAGLASIPVGSAGTFGWDAHPATPEAVAVCREAGIDIAGHRSRPLDGALLASADLVLAMELSHIAWIHKFLSGFPGTAHLLGALHPQTPGFEIDDPYGQSIDAYRRTLGSIRICVAEWVRRIAVLTPSSR